MALAGINPHRLGKVKKRNITKETLRLRKIGYQVMMDSILQIDKEKTIISPGKFEGEKYYVPYYYDLYLDGAYDEITEAKEIMFKIDQDDKEMFPELLHVDSLYLFQDDQGFIYCCVSNEEGLTTDL